MYKKPSKEKIYKSNKYIEMCIKIYRNACRKILSEIIKDYIKNKVYNYVKFVKNVCRKIC